MNKLERLQLLLVLLFATLFGTAQKQSMARLIRENFAFADSQYHLLMQHVPANKMPQSYNTAKNKWDNREIQWWCSGFYPGCLWYIFEETKDTSIKAEAQRALAVLKPNMHYTGNHDLGFMMFCSFGNGFRLTKDSVYKNILIASAATLGTRFRPGIPAIQSWDKYGSFKCPVIIDNMMNLELLEWVSQNGGGRQYGQMAVEHANTTLKNHFRPDFSSYHVVDYDTATGKVLQKKTAQGYSDASAWARGQGWALYGFTMMYRFTQDTAYLNLAKHVAFFILTNPALPKDKIPYWDFNDPAIPSAVKDASAGAVIASALLELGQYSTRKEKKWYVDNAEEMIRSLSSAAYRAKAGSNGGFLLMHSTGALPLRSEIDVPLIYADYYYLEALKRYKDWYL